MLATRSTLLCIVAALLSSWGAEAQTSRLTLLASSDKIALDGQLTEAAWTHALRFVPRQYSPVPGGLVEEATDLRLTHDGQSLFVAGVLSVRPGAGLIATSIIRDRVTGDDAIELLIDGFGDRERGLGFRTTPTGVRIDFSVARDGQEVNFDWN